MQIGQDVISPAGLRRILDGLEKNGQVKVFKGIHEGHRLVKRYHTDVIRLPPSVCTSFRILNRQRRLRVGYGSIQRRSTMRRWSTESTTSCFTT